MDKKSIAGFEKTHNMNFIYGPSFKDATPDQDQWETFKKNVTCQNSLGLTSLWFDKARAANGIPKRKDFSFEELVHFGSNLYMAKQEQDKRWLTTFCGDGIVKAVGFDATGKYLEDFATPETLEFWTKSLKILTKQHKPYMEFSSLEFVDLEFINCTSINLPLISEGSDYPDMVMTHEAYTDKK